MLTRMKLRTAFDCPCISLLVFMLVLEKVCVFSDPQNPFIAVPYTVPSGFNFTCRQASTTSRAQNFDSSNLFTPIIISKESNFAWGLVISSSHERIGSPTCSLSIVCYSCKAYYLAWSACCDGHGKVFSNGTMLKLGEQRDLQLVDSQGFLLWSSKAGNVESIELLETGNLLLFGAQSTIIWQSFKNPSNILLPGQTLTPGMRLIAGEYFAAMEPGGLVLYVNVSQTPLPYLVLNSTWGLSDLQAVRKPVCSGLTLVYAVDGSSLIMETSIVGHETSIPCTYNGSLGNTIAKFNRTVNIAGLSGFKYLRLELNGGLQTYIDDKVDFSWFDEGDDSEGRGYCNLPGHCGDLGICDPGGQCRCPHGLSAVDQAPDYLMATDYSVEEPEIDDCPPIAPANCSGAATATSYKVLKLQDLDYFPHKYLASAESNSSLQMCVTSCMQNCSCLVAFYNQMSLNCHHYGTVLSMQRTTFGGKYLVFIKMLESASGSADKQLQPHTSFSNHRLNFIAISIIFGVSLIVCLTVFMWVYKHYGSWSDEEYAAHGGGLRRNVEDDVFWGSLSGLPPRYSVKEMQQITNGFSVKLGQGSFGCVYEGSLSDGSKIAVKRLEGSRQGEKEFRAEVASLAGISHVNLVTLRGFCAEQGHRMLIYEYMRNGSLDRWLARGAAAAVTGLDWRQRLNIAVDAARGLAYLHAESRDRIFHLDVKPQNILLNDQFAAKLSDFGLSKQLDRARSRTTTSLRGTPGYLAPEWLLQTAVSDKCDVYSFGMVLLELVSGRRNVDYSGFDPERLLDVDYTYCFWPAWVVKKVVGGFWPDIRTELSARGWPSLPTILMTEGERAIKVALWCLQEDPKSRPTMSTVLLMLEGLLHVADPPLQMRLALEAQARLLASLHPSTANINTTRPFYSLDNGPCTCV